jgi:protein SDA1
VVHNLDKKIIIAFVMTRHNNQLPDNLPQLQNLIKRDPQSYKDDFLQQYEHFLSCLQIFKLSPANENKNLEDLVTFLAQVSYAYAQFNSELILISNP